VIAVVAVVAIAIYAIWYYPHVSSSAAQNPNALPSIPPPAATGAKAIPFEVDTPLGPFTSVSLAGKPYLLEIFATWCPHCQRETKVLRALRAKIPASKLAMVSVSGSPFGQGSTVGTNIQESQADVDAFDKQYGVTWPAFYDANLTVARLWGMAGFPMIYIVDKNSIIRYAGAGDQDLATLMKGIKKAGVL
jgi:thiol-disulfide isomerase/thioredoxin